MQLQRLQRVQDGQQQVVFNEGSVTAAGSGMAHMKTKGCLRVESGGGTLDGFGRHIGPPDEETLTSVSSLHRTIWDAIHNGRIASLISAEEIEA
ncbi:hypothetical protein F2P81_017406 [Scophthalmus maximus]|uniref:Uncharacterized protein n=1 Tax=Scophthalmus maximus TaxID=52904 RepID=A0A6A4SDV8_SCOMX|nr:hypothetical protein F2P81_017406 [Scophthalmus maximus]